VVVDVFPGKIDITLKIEENKKEKGA